MNDETNRGLNKYTWEKNSEGQLTKRAKRVWDDIIKDFLINEEFDESSFEYVLKKLGGKNHDKALAELRGMLNEYGIECPDHADKEDYQRIVAREVYSKRYDRIMDSLFDHFDEYPTPTEYVERIVNRQLREEDKKWLNDPLRLRILKQFIKYGDYLTLAGYGASSAVIRKYVAETKLKDYNMTQLKKKRDLVCDNLDDGIFDYCKNKEKNVKYESNQEMYENRMNLISYLEDKIENVPENGIDTLLNKKAWKAWVKKTKFDSEISEDILAKIEEYNKLCNRSREREKEVRKGIRLVTLVEDLVNGGFRTGGSTKQAIYLFAMVYGMSYKPDNNDKQWDDVEIRLFREYYVNNLMRFITTMGSGENGISGTYEREPAGRGINYKNYAEVIYLYCIYNEGEPLYKIARSVSMIKKVQELYAARSISREQRLIDRQTQVYIDGLSSHINDREDKFVDWVVDTFDCNVDVNTYEDIMNQIDTYYALYHGLEDGVNGELEPYIKMTMVSLSASILRYVKAKERKDLIDQKTGLLLPGDNGDPSVISKVKNAISATKNNTKINPLTVNQMQFSAFYNYKKLMEQLSNLYGGMKMSQIRITEPFAMDMFDKYRPMMIEKKLNRVQKETNQSITKELVERINDRADKFRHMLLAFNNFWIDRFSNGDVDLTDAAAVTRTSIILVYYYYYLKVKYYEEQIFSFESIFNEFKMGVDAYLTDSGYQEFDGSNIFDVMIAFCCYSEINETVLVYKEFIE